MRFIRTTRRSLRLSDGQAHAATPTRGRAACSGW